MRVIISELVVLLLALTGCKASNSGALNQAAISAPVDTASGVSPGECDRLASPFGNGSGSADDPYLICTASQLQAINGSSDSFLLTDDIDLASFAWDIVNFSGHLNGQNHVISNLTANSQGLFSQNSGIIENIGIDNFNITADSYAAILVSDNELSGEISHVAITHSQLNSLGWAGGISSNNYGWIHDVVVDVILTGGLENNNTTCVGAITAMNDLHKTEFDGTLGLIENALKSGNSLSLDDVGCNW